MELIQNLNGNSLEIAIIGRLDTTTAPQLEQELQSGLDGVTDLTLNLKQLDYISSAGLRVILSTQKRMLKQGAMKVTEVEDAVLEIFEMTGFSDFLTIE